MKIPDLRDYEGETIINLINNSESENKNIKVNDYGDFHYPNYNIDMKTLNGILFKNHGFEDFGSMFKYYLYRIGPQFKEEKEVNNDILEKKKIIEDYFKKYKDVFKKFKDNKIELTIIINNLKELKEFYLVCVFLEILETQKYFIKENLKYNNKNNEILLPNKNVIEERFGSFFYKEKNEFEDEVYSEINYYYISKKEEEIMKSEKKYVQVQKDYKIYYHLNFENIFKK